METMPGMMPRRLAMEILLRRRRRGGRRGVRLHLDGHRAALHRAAQWAQHDAHPLVQESASLLPEHDDRAQFLAGVDIFLAGVASRER